MHGGQYIEGENVEYNMLCKTCFRFWEREYLKPSQKKLKKGSWLRICIRLHRTLNY